MLSSPQRRTSCGVFIPLPLNLAKQFPPKEEDSSPPHVTLLFIGKITETEFEKVVEAVRSVGSRVAPFTLSVNGVDQFTNEEGQIIPHMKVKAEGCNLGKFHAQLAHAIEGQEIPVGHNYGEDYNGEPRAPQFTAHVTLAYLNPGETYNGPKPSGRWEVSEIEVWGHNKVKIPLRTPNHGEF